LNEKKLLVSGDFVISDDKSILQFLNRYWVISSRASWNWYWIAWSTVEFVWNSWFNFYFYYNDQNWRKFTKI